MGSGLAVRALHEQERGQAGLQQALQQGLVAWPQHSQEGAGRPAPLGFFALDTVLLLQDGPAEVHGVRGIEALQPSTPLVSWLIVSGLRGRSRGAPSERTEPTPLATPFFGLFPAMCRSLYSLVNREPEMSISQRSAPRSWSDGKRRLLQKHQNTGAESLQGKQRACWLVA